MSTEVYVDYRETYLIEKLNNTIVKNLELGDVQLLFNNEPKIIIERKSISDLAQSIKDNRYKEQKLRLLAYRNTNSNIKIIYVLEGYYCFDDGFSCSNMNNNILASSIINTMLRDGIFIQMTKNQKDTVDFINNVADRFCQCPEKYSERSIHSDYCSVVSSNVKSKKKDNIDGRTCFVMQLACIPGISSKKALDIQANLNVSSMAELIKYLNENGSKSLHANVQGIGKTLANNIYKFLFDDK